MTQYSIAFKIASDAHSGQYRRNGITPYINHPLQVSRKAWKHGPTVMAIALLHDTLEDNPKYTTQVLLDAGLEKEIVDAVVLLTKIDGDDYFNTYLPRVKTNKLAKIVKIYDIISNLNDDPSDKQLAKYSKALAYLHE